MKTWLQVAALLVECILAEVREDLCFAPPNTIMTCDNRGLSLPPPGRWLDISSLDLSHNAIALHRETFAAFPNVAVLKMKGNALAELDTETFAKMPYMETLDLQDNAIRAIVPPSAEEAALRSLRYLFLNNNAIQSMDPDVLQAAAPNLKYLFLNNNPLVVPSGKPVINHQELVLVHAQLGARMRLGPWSFAGAPKLREAMLVGAGVTGVQGAFTTNSRLEMLSLAGNNITELTSGALAASGAVRVLWLGGNPLRRVEVAAVAAAVAPGGHLSIDDTPLACACAYDQLRCWADDAGVTLHAACSGDSASVSDSADDHQESQCSVASEDSKAHLHN